MMRALVRQALWGLGRQLRAGEGWVLVAALVLAVAAVGSVGSFTARIALALAQQSGDTLGADVLLTQRAPIAPAITQKAASLGLATVAWQRFNSVALAGEASSLVAVQAVAPGYPLRGRVLLADSALAAPKPAQGTPAPGTVWMDVRAAQALGIAVGARVQLGALRPQLAALVVDEPGRGGFTDLAPRVLMNMADLAQSGLVNAASRVQYGLQLRGTAAALAALKATLPKRDGPRWVRPQDARPELKTALDRAGRFLHLAGLATALLAAAAVALGARQHGAARRAEIALRKTLGATRASIIAGVLVQLLLLGAGAGLIGMALAYVGQAAIAQALAGVLTVALPPTPLAALFTAWVMGLVLLVGFALPPLWQAAQTPPVAVLSALPFATAGGVGPSLLAILATAGLLWWQVQDAQLAATVAVAAVVAVALLAALAWALVLALQPLQRRVGAAWRFGLGNLARRRSATVGQAVALGVGLLALLLVVVLRVDLLQAWSKRLPANAPNQFLVNIQPEQRAPIAQYLQAQGLAAPRYWPMVRARLIGLRGQPIEQLTFADPETQRWINREFNLTYTAQFEDDNQLMAGSWWSAADNGKPWLSVDEYAVKRLNLQLGDTLTLDLAGTPITLTVRNVRKVRWESLRPNFFLATPPGVLDAAPVQYLSSLYVPAAQRPALLGLQQQWSNLSVLDLDLIQRQLRGILDQVLTAVTGVFALAVVAGLLVLMAAMHGTRALRSQETAVLRVLGASTATLRAGLVAEYAALGLIAGLVATTVAQGLAWVLAVRVLDLPYTPSWPLWLCGLGGGVVLVTLLGALSMRRVLRASPRAVLG